MKTTNIVLILSLLFIGNNLMGQYGESQFKSVQLVGVPKPLAPANLVITDFVFSDAKGNSNNALDANENAEISFKLENTGEGAAFAIKLLINDSSNTKGIIYSKSIAIGNLPAGGNRVITVPIQGGENLETANPNFILKITEGNKFDADPLSISFNTQAFKKPKLVIDDAVFLNKSEDSKITVGKMVQLSIVVHNMGEGDAKSLKVEFINPMNVYPAAQTKFQLDDLKPDEVRKIDYEFFTNKQYAATDIPIKIKVSESTGKYGIMDSKSISIEGKSTVVNRLNVTEVKGDQPTFRAVSLLPDVDRNIPNLGKKNPNKFALIIGNEDYSTFQQDLAKEVNVDFAKNDAKIFRDYCEKTLGVPTENIRLLLNATYGRMKQNIDWLNKLMKSSSGDLEIYFYYAGHGLPDESTKEPYLIPVDISGSNVQSGIKLQDVYKSLTEYESLGVTVFIDACFSGGARNQELVTARGVKIVPKPDLLEGNIVSFSASSSSQSSNPYKDMQHGMFTYYLLKGLQDSKGNITYKELWDSLRKKVAFESVRINNKVQEPQVSVGSAIEGKWEGFKFN